uniref:Ribosomal protein L33 n=1 Tax=Selaginella bisulcata TaxID=1715365 RepID=A0A482CFM8_9TRAC|nr:ribosomal protein L33 [Selaginella bisulcata]QBL75995.1 ribosomal protein L33 [Selaginella bisulcata]
MTSNELFAAPPFGRLWLGLRATIDLERTGPGVVLMENHPLRCVPRIHHSPGEPSRYAYSNQRNIVLTVINQPRGSEGTGRMGGR